MSLPGCKSAFQAGFWPDCYRENTEIGPPAGRRFPARKHYCVPLGGSLRGRPREPDHEARIKSGVQSVTRL